MNEDPVTLGEVSRNVQSLRSEVKESLTGLHARLDRVIDNTVSAAIYAADKSQSDYKLQDLVREIEALKTREEKREERKAGDRRLLITAIAFPLFMGAVNMVFTYYVFIGRGN